MGEWKMEDREEAAFLDDFDAVITEAGFVEGLVPADRSRTQKPVATQQLFLLWHPKGIEANDQPSWYSLGGKGFKFGGATKKLTVGTTEQTLYETVEEGSKLKNNSRAGLLNARFEELGWQPQGSSAGVYLGLECHVMREKYAPGTRSTLDVERETLMPTEILKKPAGGGVVVEAGEVLLPLLVGKSDDDIPALSKEARVKALGISVAKIFTIADGLVGAGKLVKDGEGKYQKA